MRTLSLAVILLSLIPALPSRASEPEADRYPNFAALAQAECDGTDFAVTALDRHSPFTVLAIHGGRIEPGSGEFARLLAGTDLNLYLFEGLKPQGNRALHITSIHFDEPRAVALLKRSRTCVSVHGFKESAPRVCIGGTDRARGEKLAALLKERGLKVAVELPCARFGGTDPENILNRCTEGGVQLELSGGLRDALANDAGLRRDFAGAVRDAVLGQPSGSSARR